MQPLDVLLFLLQVTILLVGAVFFGQLAKFLRLPMVIGELIGGIILGPTVFGMLIPATFTVLFPAAGAATQSREALARVGLLLFLFLAGSELDIFHLQRHKRCILWTSLCGMLASFSLGVVLARCFPSLWGASVSVGTLRFPLLMGTALAISALPVIARILKDMGLQGSDLAVIVIAAAAIDDLVGWTLFGAILAPVEGKTVSIILPLLRTLAAVAFVLVVGHFVCRPVLKWIQGRKVDPLVTLMVLCVFVLLVATATEAIGVHAVVGAFLMGIVLKGKEGNEAVLSSPLLALLAPLYFGSVGLKANFATHFDPLLTFAITLAACLGKTLGGGLGAWLGGMTGRTALAVGFGMNARGAMAIILATVALEHHLIDERVFVSLVFMALFTSLLSAPMMGYLLRQKK